MEPLTTYAVLSLFLWAGFLGFMALRFSYLKRRRPPQDPSASEKRIKQLNDRYSQGHLTEEEYQLAREALESNQSHQSHKQHGRSDAA